MKKDDQNNRVVYFSAAYERKFTVCSKVCEQAVRNCESTAAVKAVQKSTRIGNFKQSLGRDVATV